MSGAPGPLGKIAPGQFERVIAPHLGAGRSEVLVGPRAGQDSALVRLGGGRMLAVTTDPLSVVPALGFEASARLSCHLIASDLWTTGIAPAWASITFNLPPQMNDAQLETYWLAMSDEWARLGVAVVTGHTGRYAGCDYSIIGAGTLMGVGDESAYLTPAMAGPGDRVIVTKGCAIEATAIAAQLFPRRLGARLGPDGLERARSMLGQVSVVADCRVALRVGVRERGVTALHDATEGGVLGGLLELARACGHDLAVERARIPLSPEARAACEVFGTDPYWTLSEGALIVTTRPEHAVAVLEALAVAAIPAADVGEVVPGGGALRLAEPGGGTSVLTEPRADPYWPAYQRAVDEGWE
jgi:hydrogenase expression/formation protein HypE